MEMLQVSEKPCRQDMAGFFGINRPCPCDAATLATADMNGDGRVTSLDALMILQVAAS